MSQEESKSTTYTVTGSRISPKRMRIDTGDAEFVVGKDVRPVEYLLGSLLACVNSTATMVARDMGLAVDDLTATVEGDIDYAAYRGEETDARAGFRDLRITLTVEGEVADDALEELLERVESRCPISDNVQNETAVELAVEDA